MIKIFSNINPNSLLHIIHFATEITINRVDVVAPDNFLQMAAFELPFGKSFKAHRHNWNLREQYESIAQESWVVIKGIVKCMFYDVDGSYITSHVLNAGDCSITLEGGHNYVSLQDGTLVREFKTGPYISQEADKTFI